VQKKTGINATAAAIHKHLGVPLFAKCGYEAGLWPATDIDDTFPGALPRACMNDAFGVSIQGATKMSKLQRGAGKPCEPAAWKGRPTYRPPAHHARALVLDRQVVD
jgi:hypothetical protein